MVAKCLNPACSAKFRTLRDGRVFVREVDGGSHENGEHAHQVAYFWLCGSCCRTMAVIAEKGMGVRAVLLPTPAAARDEAYVANNDH